MTVFVAILLTVMTIAFIAYPLFRQRQRVAASGGEDRFWELYSRRDATYSMLKELEFDFQSGILTEQDYRDLEARYRGRAISVLRDIDAVEEGIQVEDEEDEIEKRILELRRSKGAEAEIDDEIEKQVRQLRRSKGPACQHCGAEYQEGDRFCAQCGESLRQGESVD